MLYLVAKDETWLSRENRLYNKIRGWVDKAREFAVSGSRNCHEVVKAKLLKLGVDEPCVTVVARLLLKYSAYLDGKDIVDLAAMVPKLRRRLQARAEKPHQHLVIDEVQDCSADQLLLIQLLAPAFTCVGDPRRSQRPLPSPTSCLISEDTGCMCDHHNVPTWLLGSRRWTCAAFRFRGSGVC